MESDVQRAICEYLALRKVFFFRCNNQPIFDPTRKVFRKLPKYTPKGIADILAIKDGKAIFIEVKRDNGRLSDEQHVFGRNDCARMNMQKAAIIESRGRSFAFLFALGFAVALAWRLVPRRTAA